MFKHIQKRSEDYVLTTDIGKLNRFKYKQGFDFSFFLKDAVQRKIMLLVSVKFKEKKYEPIPTDYAYKNENGELCFPQDQPADTLFDLVFFGKVDEEKNAMPERPKFKEPVFSGFQNYKI
ncbi:MAG: hypothetical protein ACTHLE_07245 [Agriterribacter sp.]